ncbi:unnamed protein product [Rotaria sordida]|uniref:Uncharacterized protein n=1 Tax=Rotaria sordida TaxID=392033 RepID=A0A813V3V9_9BILA|nr:unnamed protein product [Rotaria sordida]CAF0878250.1 unnamed protein product [Rotaria sordida]CAF1280183.1 unnamed protein product [Rotaria sordida]CAF1280320.1 unnamed protein product [Rotaria sordida]CAF1559092.1 unnamed protein product [Rotaria sordida]
MNRQSIVLAPICFSYFLVIILLFQSTRPVQSIALSSLCGHFGHSCFGGNWGKRELSGSSLASDIIQTNIDTSDDRIDIPTAYYKTSMNNFLLEQLRSKLIRQQLRQLLELE